LNARTLAVVGGGPAGLMAAETAAAAGLAVTVYERMPTFGRRLLRAGVGGLNLTHAEPFEAFLARYGEAAVRLRPYLEALGPAELRAWAEGLGQDTFVGSGGRVFPRAMKASPLLRAWLARLRERGVRLVPNADWLGWDGQGLVFRIDGQPVTVRADATVLALGGASWPRLGADGSWAPHLAPHVKPLRPANVGFDIAWSDRFRDRFAGQPLKGIALRFAGREVRGEAMLTGYGIEGGAIYALSAPLRDAVEAQGSARLTVDLKPDLTQAEVAARLARARVGDSRSNRLRKALGLAPAAIGLVAETGAAADLAAAVKALALTVTGVQPIARAISTAGGLDLAALDAGLMLKDRPGVFAAGEMLDWEAPTGGYLLQASFATGAAAGRGAAEFLRRPAAPQTSQA
jgi:uncharacterized flavoprotein (TIGR03862 family)